MISIINKKAPVKAKIVQLNQTSSCLVASFRLCDPALVWQINLDKIPGFSLVVKQKEGEWDLGYLPVDGHFTPIAHFEDYDDAQAAFYAIEKVLLRGVRHGSVGGFLKASLSTLLMLVLIAVLGALVMSFVSVGTETKVAHVPEAASLLAEQQASGGGEPEAGVLRPRGTAPVKIETGVPMSADDVLPKNVR